MIQTDATDFRLMANSLHENEIATCIINCAFKVHTVLGPGLLESSYQACLAYEISKTGLTFQEQVALPLIYDSVQLDCGYRIDLLVERKVIVEVKAVEALNDIHRAQVLTYLKLSGIKLGCLINFNVSGLKDGVKRIILGKL